MDDVPGALKASAPLLDVLGGRKTHAWIRAAVWRLRVMARLRLVRPPQSASSSSKDSSVAPEEETKLPTP